MGKSDPSNKSYEGKSRMDLEIYYEPVDKKLTIYSDPVPSSTKEVQKLQKQFDNYKEETDAKIRDMQRQHREDVTHPITDDAINKRIEKILKNTKSSNKLHC